VLKTLEAHQALFPPLRDALFDAHLMRGGVTRLWPAMQQFTDLSDYFILDAMADVIGVFVGRFGRVALFDASAPVLGHAHSQMHILIKIDGNDCHYGIGGESVHLTDDRMVLVNPWIPHANPRKPGSPATILLAIYLEPLWFGDYGSTLISGSGAQLFPKSSVLVTDRTRYLAGMIARLIEDFASDEGHLEDLLLQLVRQVIEDSNEGHLPADLPTSARGVDYRIRKAVGHMRAECGRPLDRGELANAVGLSRYRIYQTFKACVGLAPGGCLDTLRCELAGRLLAEHDV